MSGYPQGYQNSQNNHEMDPRHQFQRQQGNSYNREMANHANNYTNNAGNPAMYHNPHFQQNRGFNSKRNYNSRWGPIDQGPNTTETHPQKRRKVDNEVTISKQLAYILRHGALNMGLKMNKQGFIYVNDILKLRKFQHVTLDDIIRIVKNNNKQRFNLQKDPRGNLMIGANQGHTMKVEELDLTPITDAKSYPCVVHGTTYEAWGLIKGVGLKTMGRTHIHFASGEPGEKGVISGMRNSSQVLIYIDLGKALERGIKFSLSRNGVILSEGDRQGIIDSFFFKAVIDRNTRSLEKKNSSTKAVTDDRSRRESLEKKNSFSPEAVTDDQRTKESLEKKNPVSAETVTGRNERKKRKKNKRHHHH